MPARMIIPNVSSTILSTPLSSAPIKYLNVHPLVYIIYIQFSHKLTTLRMRYLSLYHLEGSHSIPGDSG